MPLSDEQMRLECLKLVVPKDGGDVDCSFYVDKADALFNYVMNGKPRRGRPPKSDKPQGPDESL